LSGYVVDPGVIIEKYGADTARLFILFASPPENDLEWSDKGVEGSFRFLNRVWRLVNKLVEYKKESTNNRKEDLKEKKDLLRKTHITIKRVTRDVEKEFHFNTAIALVMELVNHLYQYKNFGDEVSCDAVETVVLLLSPFTPHICEEMWEILGNKESILKHPWPEYNPEHIKQDEILIIIQVNGKVRNKILVPAGLEQKEIVKVISVPKKLVNIVVKLVT
jgi:leucyl-tRNA synthetase